MSLWLECSCGVSKAADARARAHTHTSVSKKVEHSCKHTIVLRCMSCHVYVRARERPSLWVLQQQRAQAMADGVVWDGDRVAHVVPHSARLVVSHCRIGASIKQQPACISVFTGGEHNAMATVCKLAGSAHPKKKKLHTWRCLHAHSELP